MKYIIAVADGVSDWPLEELGGQTPMMAAHTPTIDALCKTAELGHVRTIPQGVAPGSDTAFLSILGFDPKDDYTGRAPLEAMALGIDLNQEDVALRLNFIGITPNVPEVQVKILSHAAGGMTHEEGTLFLQSILTDAACQRLMRENQLELYEGTAYRHCLIARNAKPTMLEGKAPSPPSPHNASVQAPDETPGENPSTGGAAPLQTTPPHDVLGQALCENLPAGGGAEPLRAFMRTASRALAAHPHNAQRVQNGQMPVNFAFAWGQGSAPVRRSLKSQFGLSGACITAVPLVAGVCACRSMQNIPVEGATGELDTNYQGKAEATLAAMQAHDLVLVHVEAPDECGHAGNVADKIESVQRFDERLIAPILAGLGLEANNTQNKEPVRLLILGDHATPIASRTHAADPVPYLLWQSDRALGNDPNARWNENCAPNTPPLESGLALLKRFLSEG